MEESLSPEEQQELINQLHQTKQELEELRSEGTVQTVSPQDKFIETLFDKGGGIFIEYSKMKAENDKYEIEQAIEIEKEELVTIDKIDFREKLYKGILLTVCIVALVLVPIFIKDSQMIIPVLSLIVGLLFQSNSVTDFISFRKNKREEGE